jgi:hypothetical protein
LAEPLELGEPAVVDEPEELGGVDGLAEDACWLAGAWLGAELGVGLEVGAVLAGVMVSPDSGSQTAVRLAMTLIPPQP